MSKLAKYASIASVYAAAIGFLYLWGYWGRFGINFLEFASLGDLVRLSAMPIVGGSLVTLVVYGYQTWTEHPAPNMDEAATVTELSARTKFWLLILRIVFAASAFAFIVDRIRFKDEPAWWALVALIVGMWTQFRLRGKPIAVLTDVPEPGRGILLFAVASLPCLSYGLGSHHARDIERGQTTATRYADYARWNGGSVKVGNSRYLGTLGDFAFFWTNEKTILITEWDQIAPLELTREASSPPQ